jgi:amino acid carrier protein
MDGILSNISLDDIIAVVDEYIWYLAFIVLIGAGLYLTYKFKGIQFTRFIESMKLSFGGTKSTSEQSVSSMEAFWVGVGARIGIGKIAGVAMAIILGGAGAIFWIWVFALISCASCFAECTLGQIFKDKKSDGLFHGGPAYYIRDGLKNPKFAKLVAILIVLTYAVGFIGIQASSATASLVDTFDAEKYRMIFAIALAATTGLMMIRGIKGVAKSLAKIVPLVSIVWFFMVIVTVVFNWRYIDDAIIMIVKGAFGLDSIMGGTLAAAVMWGMKRSVFSNTAGIGAIPNVSSAADVRHPVEQGLSQSFGVILDTIICTGTALIILTSSDMGSLLGIGNGIELVSAAMAAGPFGVYAPYLLTGIILIFVIISIVSSYSICEVNLMFLSEKPIYSAMLKIGILLSIFVSSILPADIVWSLSDILMAALGIANMVAVLKLTDYVMEALRDYNRQRAANKVPVFNRSRISLDASGISVWGERTDVDVKPETAES